jgi:hypothetical protein
MRLDFQPGWYQFTVRRDVLHVAQVRNPCHVDCDHYPHRTDSYHHQNGNDYADCHADQNAHDYAHSDGDTYHSKYLHTNEDANGHSRPNADPHTHTKSGAHMTPLSHIAEKGVN